MNINFRRISWAVICSLVLSLCLGIVVDTKSVGMVRRGDFPAFYSAAVIVSQGRADKLYHPDEQRQIQNSHWPSLEGNYFAYSYPPPHALLLWPLARFSADTAKQIFFLFNMLLFVAAFLLLRKEFSTQGSVEMFAVCLSFAPLFVGLVAGQNAGLAFFLLCLIRRFLLSSLSWQSDLLLGLLSSFLLYKPHFSLVTLLLLLVACQPLAVFSGWVIGATVFYFLGVLLFDPLWPAMWLKSTFQFAALDFPTNGFQMVSAAALCQEIVRFFGFTDRLSAAFGFTVTILFFIFVVLAVERSKNPRRTLAYVIGPAVLFLGIHVLYYEMGLLLPVFFELTRRRECQTRDLFVLNSLFFAVGAIGGWLHLPLLSVVMTFVFITVLWTDWFAPRELLKE